MRSKQCFQLDHIEDNQRAAVNGCQESSRSIHSEGSKPNGGLMHHRLYNWMDSQGNEQTEAQETDLSKRTSPALAGTYAATSRSIVFQLASEQDRKIDSAPGLDSLVWVRSDLLFAPGEELVSRMEMQSDTVSESLCFLMFVRGMPAWQTNYAQERLSLLVESMQTSNIQLDMRYLLTLCHIYSYLMILDYIWLYCWICRSMSQLIQALGLVQQIPCSSRARFACECRREQKVRVGK